MANPARFVWIDDGLRNASEGQVSFLSAGLQYGFSVFEGIRCYASAKGPAVFRLREHAERLLDSAHIIGFRDLPFSLEQVSTAIQETVAANEFPACYIRPMIYLEGALNMVTDAGKPRLMIAVWEWGAFLGAEARERGIRANISSITRLHPNIMMTKAKVSGNYVGSILAKTESQRLGFDEAIMMDPQGYVAECTGENIFVVRNRIIYTVPRGSILEGLTRDSVITLARDAGYEVVEEQISRDQLYMADEVFVTGTAAEVIGLREIDFRTIGEGKTGPVTRTLQDAFDQVTIGKHARSEQWLSYVRQPAAARARGGVFMKKHQHRRETEAVRAGSDLSKKNGPLATPIYQTSTFEVTDSEQQVQATHTDMFYTRYGNPTHTVVENAIAELEGTDAALLFASGMTAITTTMLALVKSGDHIVAQRDIYGGVTKFLSTWLSKFGVETTFVDTIDYAQHAHAMRPNTKLLHLESPTNPTLRVVDLHKVVAVAKEHGVTTLIDSTFATPMNQRPADFGIDLVMHSGTKYFNGHSDLIAGIVAGRKDLIDRVHETRTTLGGNMDPHAAWLLLRGIKTMAVRVERQNENALKVARFLAKHAKVKAVNYPFEESHPQRALAMEQMRGGGGVLSFEVDGSGEDAKKVAESLRLFTLAPSLGGVDSLVTLPVLTSHAMIAAEQRKKMGVTEQLIRLSVGIENADDLIADLEQALKVVSGDRRAVEVG